MSEHLTDQQLQDFVTNGIDAAAVMQHSATCQNCEARLQREARLEASMFEVARYQNDQRRIHGVRFAAIAAAAALIVFAGRFALRPQPHVSLESGVVSEVVACFDDAQLDACRREARAHGKVVEAPFDPDDVPIYEAMQEGDAP